MTCERLKLSDDEVRMMQLPPRATKADGLRRGDENVIRALADRNPIEDWRLQLDSDYGPETLISCKKTPGGIDALRAWSRTVRYGVAYVAPPGIHLEMEFANDPIKHDDTCDCGTVFGARVRSVPASELRSGETHRREPIPLAERCCAVCHRVNVEKREVRGHDALVRCFECHPHTGYERLEKLRGKPYGVGESPDADVSALLDKLESIERAQVTYDDCIPSQEQLARAMFIAANVDEVMCRAEIDADDIENAGPMHMSVRVREVVPTMWDDPHYARQRVECEKAAERVWSARRCVR